VNYENFIDTLVTSILPLHFGFEVTEEMRERLLDVSTKYSKGRGGKTHEWKEDNTKKDQAASDAVKQAAELFLAKSYTTLVEIAPPL